MNRENDTSFRRRVTGYIANAAILAHGLHGILEPETVLNFAYSVAHAQIPTSSEQAEANTSPTLE